MSNEITFTPVPRRKDRHDGWTDAKQAAFIELLAKYGMVRAAAEKLGMSATSAYRLRNAEGGQSFADAWDEALMVGQIALADIAMDRAVNGVAVPTYYKGKLVGERRWYDNRLLMFMLRQTQTRRYGRHAADHDFAEEILRAERAAVDRQLKLVKQAEDLSDTLRAEATLFEAGVIDAEQHAEIRAQIVKLSDLIYQIEPVDAEVTLAREQFSASGNRKKWRWQPQSVYLRALSDKQAADNRAAEKRE